jgi:hypothetical protein
MNGKLCLNAEEGKEIQGSNTHKPSLENDKTSTNEKSVNRKKRKSNVEKSLVVVMKKFQESSNGRL